MRQIIPFFLCLAIPAGAQQARSYSLKSPDGRTEVAVSVGERVTYSVTRSGRPIIAASPISLALDGGRSPGRAARVAAADVRQVRDSIRAFAPTKNAVIQDRYGELRLRFRDSYDLELRAYDDGVAYRWVLAMPDSVTVVSEEATFDVVGSAPSMVGLDSSFQTHYEPAYRRVALDTLRGSRMGLLPLLVWRGDEPKVAITESALESYPGMYLASGRETGGGGTTLKGVFPAYALADTMRNDRDVPVTRRAPYIARIAGRRSLPWRAILIADRDAQLLENQLVYKLASPSRLADVAWIRPGLVSWDWWNANNVKGVPFRAGVNTDTYKYYIDFASRYGIPFIILDEGWYKLGDLLQPAPNVDVPELVRYGRTKNVGIILWAIWKTLDLQMQPAMDQFTRWGIAGLKVDFMQRDDQAIVDFYWRLAREAAARKLTLDFHGAHKPAGLDRTYPNVLTFEGVRGLEQNKWSTEVSPDHDVLLPYTRMLAGPMDYTPGAMNNSQPRDFRAVNNRPMSQGTRAHQLALYVIYESRLQMLADTPSEYLREPEAMDFLRSVPVLWDETHALDGRVGEFAVMARRNGSDWYLGALGNRTGRTLTVDLSFLGDGRYTLDVWADGPNADRDGRDFRRETRTVSRGDKLELVLAPGGGYAARIRPLR